VAGAARDGSLLITWRIDARISSTVWSCAKLGFAIVMPWCAPAHPESGANRTV
jgi:hypothetical protein